MRVLTWLLLLAWTPLPIASGLDGEGTRKSEETDVGKETRKSDETAKEKETKDEVAEPRKFPVALDRPYEYVWRMSDEAVVSLTLVFRERRDANGSWLVLRTERRLSLDGKGMRGSGELHFESKSGRPISYTEETEARQRQNSGRQEVEVRFERDTAKTTTVNNGNIGAAIKHTIPLTRDVFFFGTNAIDHWTVFATKLRDRRKTTIPVLYPEFARVIELEFTPADADEELRIGERTVRVRRFEFRYREF